MEQPIHISQTAAGEHLRRLAAVMEQPGQHLKHLLDDPARLTNFSRRGGGLFFDFSRQRIAAAVLTQLLAAADELNVQRLFSAMCRGAKLNVTEGRAVLHTATRDFSDQPILVDGIDVMPAIRGVRRQLRDFSAGVHQGAVTGDSGRPFRHVVVIGIGGSYLGPEFVSTALGVYADKGLQLHYLANVDINDFGAVAAAIDPPTTLWVIISKSYTTAETTANTLQAETFMRAQGLDPARHMVTVTAQGSPGDDPRRPVLGTFHMFDFIGGRYSVTSAVGGVPLSLVLGYERFEEFLRGAAEMDEHARSAPAAQNLPLLAALIAVWNSTFLGYAQQAVIPYAAPLAKLAAHIQQLSMESNGKAVDRLGRPLAEPAGMVIFGEPGTNAQHSFFQLAHQGRPFPIDFIGVLQPQYSQYSAQSKGVTNHQELWANLLAQARALALGRPAADAARRFDGNRPSSTLVLEALDPLNVGRLLSFYEARTVFEGFLWGINSFDQFGVELGKTMAEGLRRQMAARNADAAQPFDTADPIAQRYLEMLYAGKLS